MARFAVLIARMPDAWWVAVVQYQVLLVFGTWGCGVFRNDPAEAAKWFGAQLLSGTLKNAFRVVVAILDRSAERVLIDRIERQFTSAS